MTDRPPASAGQGAVRKTNLVPADLRRHDGNRVKTRLAACRTTIETSPCAEWRVLRTRHITNSPKP